MNRLNIAVVQFDIIWDDTRKNLNRLDEMISGLKAGTDVLILPEMFHCGFSMSTQKNEQVDGGEVLKWMKQTSCENECVVIGSVVVKSDCNYYNRLYVVDADKEHWYDKRHLFTMGNEHLYYQKGMQRIIVDVKGWKICPMICYDLRFPVWSRNKGGEYDVLIYVANWPASRGDVWDTLLKARAIENQSYVIGVNRVGNDGSLNYDGRTQVLDAKGENMINVGNVSDVAYVALDYDKLAQFRQKFPVLYDGDNYEIMV